MFKYDLLLRFVAFKSILKTQCNLTYIAAIKSNIMSDKRTNNVLKQNQQVKTIK